MKTKKCFLKLKGTWQEKTRVFQIHSGTLTSFRNKFAKPIWCTKKDSDSFA